MLSYIYQVAYQFERSHELRPNTLYLNLDHFEHLRNEFSDPDDIDAISAYLGMHLILCHDALHPHVAYHVRNWHKSPERGQLFNRYHPDQAEYSKQS